MTQKERQERRFQRQIQRMTGRLPLAWQAALTGHRRGVSVWRVPLGILLVLGGLLGALPVLGFWMLPLGLVLLAVDLPVLRPFVNRWMIRGRRWLRGWRGRR